MAQKLSKKNTKVQKIVKKVVPVTARSAAKAGSAGATATPKVAVNLPTGEYVEATGRRKTASARARLYKQPGEFIVNGRAAGQYFANVSNSHVRYQQPFVVTETQNKFAVSITVKGSGTASQLGAAIHAISRALLKMDEAHRLPLKQAGLLTRDDRMKETRKIGMGGKARRKRQSPKR